MPDPRYNRVVQQISDYQQDRRRVLLALDPAQFMTFVDRHLQPVVRARLRACWQRDGDKFLLLVMHKLRSVLNDIPLEDRDVSILWLHEHGVEPRSLDQMLDEHAKGWPDPEIP